MSKWANFIRPLMPILSAIYGFLLIYVTAMPMADGSGTIGAEAVSWMLTLAAIVLTCFLVKRVEPIAFPEANRFSLKFPALAVAAGLLLMAPLWMVVEGGTVYGLTSLMQDIQLEPITYSTDELREDLLSGIHAVLLAPVLEELCFRQLAISPFRRRGSQVVVCVVMALLFGSLHVRNFPGAFLSAMVYGLVFIWSRNVWYAILLHAGHNLTATLLAVYCASGLGELQMSKTPVIILPDTKVIIVSALTTLIGLYLILNHKALDKSR